MFMQSLIALLISVHSHTANMHFGDKSLPVELNPFSITTPDTQFVTKDGSLKYDPNAVALFVSEDNNIFVAKTQNHVYGIAFVDGGEWSLQTTVDAEMKWHEVDETLPPIGVPVCGTIADDARRTASRLGTQSNTPLSLELAIETDYEYAELFSGDLNEAADYIVALYGAVSFIYQRDVNISIELVFARLWDTPDDLFNNDNPFGQFANYWNENMSHVERDLAQFLTGRTNLPYGGVASLSAVCSSSGYSVSGYTMGSFYSATEPSFANWDVIVAAHEIGHNCGTGHTHDYDLDECAYGAINRGSIMSYCHTSTGGNANQDMRFHTYTSERMRDHLESVSCLDIDCNGNHIDDAEDIASGLSTDDNGNSIPDECEDCNQNGTLDPTDIATGSSQDANDNGVPDECEPDCNMNGLPDSLDIANGTSADAWGNGIPDECELDCDGDGVSDYNQIQNDMTLDINRNAILDACEDCDGNAIPDEVDLAGNRWIWIAGTDEDAVKAFHPSTGVPITETSGDTVIDGRDVVISGNYIFVSHGSANRVAVYDRQNYQYVSSLTTGLYAPEGMATTNDGRLLVVSRNTDSVEQFDASTLQSLGTLIETNAGGLNEPRAIVLTLDEHILVSSDNHNVLEFDANGEFVRELIAPSAGGLDTPLGIVQHPDGQILVTSNGTNSIESYNRNTGEHIERFDRGGLESGYWGLGEPWAIRVGPDGDIYVSTHDANTAIQVYEASTGLFKRRFYILSQLAQGATGFAFAPSSGNDCNGNLILDACDINSGESSDLNQDGTPDECQCITDVNTDGQTNVSDLLAVIDAWGQSNSPADVNGDGVVNVSDVLLIISAWGPCTP